MKKMQKNAESVSLGESDIDNVQAGTANTDSDAAAEFCAPDKSAAKLEASGETYIEVTDSGSVSTEYGTPSVVDNAEKGEVRHEKNSSQMQHKKNPFKGFFHSIRVRLGFSFLFFSVVLVGMFWAVFITFIYTGYAHMVVTSSEAVCKEASQAFPFKIDDNSMHLYKMRMSDFTRENGLTLAVFTRSGDSVQIVFTSDTMGNIGTEAGDLLNAVISETDFETQFAPDGVINKFSTEFGTYLCYGEIKHTGSMNPTPQGLDAYLLIIEPYNLFNNQTMMIINSMIICSIIVLVLACLFSFVASNFQTKHITDMSQKARKVADGNYNVMFSGGGCVEYEDLANALNAAKDEMYKTERMRRDMIANVSHDIRTPLTMIRANAEMLRDMPLPETKRAKTANVIMAEADRLNGLVEDMLALSKLQSDVAAFDLKLKNVSDIATAVLGRFDIYRTRDGVKFDAHIEKGVMAVCDTKRIEQVLYNLINNAINYSGEDKTVIINVMPTEKGGARVEIGDNGKGIPTEEIDSVWDRYYRAAQTKRTTVGSGLGLSICKSILVKHNAKYGINSTVGVGTTFWFELTA